MPRRGPSALAAVAVAAALTISGPQSASAGAAGHISPTRPANAAGVEALAGASIRAGAERPGFFDARTGSTAANGAALTRQAARRVAATAEDLRRGNGRADLQLVVDPATGTPAHLAATDGYLTGPSTRSATAIVRAYVRANAGALGLTRADLDTFRLRSSDTDSSGVTHLSYEQVTRGIPVFGNGLKAHLTRRGELISVQGAPISGLDRLTARLSSTPALSAEQARGVAAKDVGGTPDAAASERSTASASARWSNGDRADLVWFVGGDRAVLGWKTYTQAGDTLNYSHVISSNGRMVYRNDLVDFARPTREARVYEYHPGSVRGGLRIVNLVKEGWIRRRAPWLRGANVSAWADIDDDDRVDDREKTPLPGRDGRPQFILKKFLTNPACTDVYVCTWDPETTFSWRRNKKADVTNAFYLANRFHDWLARPAIGFDAGDGNFQRNGGDPLLLHAMDGANTANGLPDADHVNNANMSTPPDGVPPTMQMYLLHEPGTSNAEDPFLPTSTSFETNTLYHEYVHGLSNRLVTDASGNSTLNSVQARAMGEAWSDYYSVDYLVHKGFIRDTKRDGQLRDGEYVHHGEGGWRTQAVDCDPDSTAKNCTDIYGGSGGYTYGDFPDVGGGGPQAHDSGEIWGQTLWDIREGMGSVPASRIITQAMRLSPADPTMLDMRNAILQADQVINDGANNRRLWKIFAARGLGWYAGVTGGGDGYPAESFELRPAPERGTGAVAGTLTDDQTGTPIRGVRVVITGHGDRYADTTDASGSFFISDVPPGRYLKMTLGGKGYDPITRKVRIRRDQVTDLSMQLRRDWAAASRGGRVVDFTGPDLSAFGCGAENVIDLSQGTGWVSTTGADSGEPTATPQPKRVDIELPVAIDIAAGGTRRETAFKVDPSNNCGTSGSTSTNDYRIEVSNNDGATWIEVADAAFGTDPATSRGRYFPVRSDTAVADVTMVRFWMDSPQVPDIATNCPDGAYGGCEYMAMAELQVYGTPGG
jgi:hypothetical protein